MTAFDSFSRLSPAIQWHVVAALGPLLPGRFMGQLLWRQTLGWA